MFSYSCKCEGLESEVLENANNESAYVCSSEETWFHEGKRKVHNAFF